MLPTALGPCSSSEGEGEGEGVAQETVNCRMCGCLVDDAAIRSGAALRVGEGYLCPSCLAQLPFRQRQLLYQLASDERAFAGVFRHPVEAHPQQARFTYTTHAAVMAHHRLLRHGGVLERPEAEVMRSFGEVLGQTWSGMKTHTTGLVRRPARWGRRAIQQLAVVSQQAASSEKGQTSPENKNSAGQTNGRGSQWLLLFAAVIVAAMTGFAVAILLPRSPAEAIQPAEVTSGFNPTRDDVATDPLVAWSQCRDLLPLSHPVMVALQQEIIIEGRRRLAKEQSFDFPSDPLFVTLAPLLAPVSPPDVTPDLTPPTNNPPALSDQVILAVKPTAKAVPLETDTTSFTSSDSVTLPLAWRPSQYHFHHDDWLVTATDHLQLTSPHGMLAADFDLPPGRYDCWLQIKGPVPPQGYLHCTLGTSSSQTLRAEDLDIAHHSMVPLALNCAHAGGTASWHLLASGAGWQVMRIMVVAAGQERPRRWADAATPAWQQLARLERPAVPEVAPQPPVRPTPRQRHINLSDVAHIRRHPIITAHPPWPIPADVPGGITPYVYSLSPRIRRKGAAVPLRWQHIVDGGLALLVHAHDHSRRQVVLRTMNEDGDIYHDVTMPVDVAAGWQVLTIAMPPPANPELDLRRLDRLVISDPLQRTRRPLLIAKMIAVSHQLPHADHLELEVRPLLPINQDYLRDRLQDVSLGRKDRSFFQNFDPTKLRYYFGHQMGQTWRTEARRWLAGVLGDKPAQDAVQYLVLHDRWLNNHFILQEAPEYHVVMISSAGAEFPVGLNERQAVVNLHQAMIREALSSGALPVVVLGPNKLNPGEAERAETVWRELQRVINDSPTLRGVPIIDLRSVNALSRHRFAPGELERGARLLSEGYRELIMHLEIMLD